MTKLGSTINNITIMHLINTKDIVNVLSYQLIKDKKSPESK